MLDKTRACRLNVDFDNAFMAFVKARNSNVNKEIKAAIVAQLAFYFFSSRFSNEKAAFFGPTRDLES